jgi:3-oxoacyl-[acyl-carrier protein] reductase
LDFGISGRVALVTGASKGIGRGIAQELVAEGAQVAICSRSPETLAQTAEEIGARGYPFDTADIGGIDRLVSEIERDLGAVDMFIANTGGPPANLNPVEFCTHEWELAHRTLVLSPLAMIRRLLPSMRARRWGRILAVGSYTVIEPKRFLQASNAHRPGLVAVFKTLAREVAADGVTLNHVHPGHIATDRMLTISTSGVAELEDYPFGRMGTVEEVAAAAAFLCSERASYITGTSLLVDGGLSRGIS